MSLKDEILKAAAVPTGEAILAGHTVKVRGLTAGEEIDLLADGLQAAVLPVCAACIVGDDGKPMFAASELEKIKGGVLKEVYQEILTLTYPAKGELEKNS